MMETGKSISNSEKVSLCGKAIPEFVDVLRGGGIGREAAAAQLH